MPPVAVIYWIGPLTPWASCDDLGDSRCACERISRRCLRAGAEVVAAGTALRDPHSRSYAGRSGGRPGLWTDRGTPGTLGRYDPELVCRRRNPGCLPAAWLPRMARSSDCSHGLSTTRAATRGTISVGRLSCRRLGPARASRGFLPTNNRPAFPKFQAGEPAIQSRHLTSRLSPDARLPHE